MKRILMLTNSLVGGGAERVVLTLAEALQKKGCYVHLILMESTLESEFEIDLPIDILHYKKRSFSNGKRLKKLIHTIEDKNGIFDLVISNLPETDRVVKQVQHPNTYYCIHTTLSKAYIEKKGKLQQLRRLWRFRNLYKNENIITVSMGVERDFIHTMKIRPKSIQTIYNPIDFDRITQKAADITVAIPSENYIVHVGNYGTVKRHDLLIKAYFHSGIHANLVLVGKNVKPHMEALVRELKLEERVFYAGFLSNPYPVIKNARMLIVSSDFEGLPTVILEALALNVEVISTDCDSGPREILTDELANNLTPVGDIDALAKKIKEVSLRMGNGNRREFISYLIPFNPEKIASRYLKLIEM